MPLGLRLFHRQWLWNVVFIQCHSDRDFLINRPISVIELFDRILNDKRLFLFYCGLTVAKWSIAQPSSSWFLVSRQTGQHLSTFNCLDRCILGNRIIHRYNFACFFYLRRSGIDGLVWLDFDDLNAESEFLEAALACGLTLVLPVTIINHGENHNKDESNCSLDKYHSFISSS